MLSISEIKYKTEHIARQINVPQKFMPSFDPSAQDAANIEIYGSNFYYNLSDRGSTVFKRSTTDLNELLYWVFCDITSYMASSFELNPKADSRKMRHKYQLELLKNLNPEWEKEREQEISEILKEHPYFEEED